MRWVLIFAITSRLFSGSFDPVSPSTSEEIASLNSTLLVEGFVSPFSGQLSLSETDLCLRGAQNLYLKRTYIAPQILGRYSDQDKADRLFLGEALKQLEYKGWVICPHLWIGRNLNSTYFQVRLPSGITLEFAVQGDRGFLKTSSYGCTNLQGEDPSSETDLRNTQLWLEGNKAKVTSADGTERHYSWQRLGLYRLEKELLPNGKAIFYEYSDQGLCKISSGDPTGTFIYATITRTNDGKYIGSDGSEVTFQYESREIKGKYTDKERDYYRERNFFFPLMNKSSNPFYSNEANYNERILLNSYDAKSYPISCDYSQIKNVPSRIQTFSTPSSSTSFSYDSPVAGQKGGSTTVTYSDEAKAVYRFNKLLLLEAIENWFEGKLVNKKTFTYDSKQHIQRIETLDSSGVLLLAKRFECDSAGNPILEKREGDFGTFSIRRKFDQNRLIFEENDDGLQCEYTYLGSTRLIASKTIFAAGIKLRKTTYAYDTANNLIEEEEEGKTKVTYTLYQTTPHLHRVEWEQKSDWDGHLICKIRYGYDQWGNTNEEQHFDSNAKLAYTIKRTYNEKGELLDETNALGQTARYRYDARGRCDYEEPISNGLVITRVFDAKGRLKTLTENDHRTYFDYNPSDELIQKTDYLGYTTSYHYHPVHGKPDRIEEPDAITEIIYDDFGREKEIINPYQARTQKNFNSYGAVAQTISPTGGTEIFSYYPNGLLKTYKDADGLITAYEYDALHRIKKKSVGDHVTIFKYDGYHLYETIDPAGFVTTYTYDLVGRKIKENYEGRITHYGYDSLGFMSWEKRRDRRIDYTNDLLGRLRIKSIDNLLETKWTYDAAGNTDSFEQDGITEYAYDPHNRLIKKTDAEGHITFIRYEKGPQTLLKKTTDPRGVETVKTYNPKGQLLKKEVAGQIVEEFEYDKLFRLKKQDHLTFGYTPNGQKEWISEAGKRTTRWTYTPGGRILTKEKPDGTILLHEYDTQGHLEKIAAREFRYDRLDRMVKGSGFSRTLDAFGNIKREEWATGLWIESEYDDWDRPLERRLSDNSRIVYEYEGPFMKRVLRYDHQGSLLYTHAYHERNAAGLVCSESGLFPTITTYNKKRAKTSQTNPYFQETIGYDPLGNVIQKGNVTYAYDESSQMTLESGKFTARYDHHRNCIERNGRTITVDDLNQLQDVTYDANGNLLKPGFIYDDFNQLVKAEGEASLYDALGRRIAKDDTTYLYIGDEEIAAYKNSQCQELKILGDQGVVAIEIGGKPFAAIQDAQETIRQLIDRKTGKSIAKNDCDAFGAGLSDEIPYAYAGKRFDPKTRLVYFGQRFYDPSLGRWLTQDPLWQVDHSNLYQYVFNNPFCYRDPTGESLGGYLFGIGQMILGGAIMAGGVGLEFISLGGFTVGFVFAEAAGASLFASGCATIAYNARNLQVDNSASWPKTGGLVDGIYQQHKAKNSNPFDGPVDEDVIIGDIDGNNIQVPEGHRLGGSKDGKCLELKTGKNEPIGLRKDGKGHPESPKHPDDPRSWDPHAHVPGISNPDGTPWLPIRPYPSKKGTLI